MNNASPNFMEAFTRLESAMRKGDRDEILSHRRACAIADPAVWMGVAESEIKAKRKDLALITLQEVLAVTDHPFLRAMSLQNIGMIVAAKGSRDAAIDLWYEALTLHPQSPEITANIGTWHYWRGHYQEAARWLNESLRIQPGFKSALFCLSMIHLSMSEWAAGWELYESRWGLSADKPHFEREGKPLPEWKGEKTKRRLLIYMEQGVGDEMWVSRWFPLVRERVGAVSMVCHAGMSRLLRSAFPWLDEIYDDPSGTVTVPEDAPVDMVIPLMSLPRLFLPRLFHEEQIPQPTRFKVGVAPMTERPTIGICWAGGIVHEQNLFRSIPWDQFKAVFVDGVDYVSLQKGPGSVELDPAAGVIDNTATLTDWMDTAREILRCDMVVACDTAVAHLAGCLGVSTCLLLPPTGDFRWEPTGETTRWYRQHRLIRAARELEWSDAVSEARRQVEAAMRRWDSVPAQTSPAA